MIILTGFCIMLPCKKFVHFTPYVHWVTVKKFFFQFGVHIINHKKICKPSNCQKLEQQWVPAKRHFYAFESKIKRTVNFLPSEKVWLEYLTHLDAKGNKRSGIKCPTNSCNFFNVNAFMTWLWSRVNGKQGYALKNWVKELSDEAYQKKFD